MVYDDLLQNPLIVPVSRGHLFYPPSSPRSSCGLVQVKVLHQPGAGAGASVVDCAFHPAQVPRPATRRAHHRALRNLRSTTALLAANALN
jgi:hypothetical protein